MPNSKFLPLAVTVIVVLTIIGYHFPAPLPAQNGSGAIQQPAHVLGAFSTNDCAKINASGFLVSNTTTCGGAAAAQIFSYGGGFVNGGSTIATAISLPVTAPKACTIIAYELSIPAADTGTATVKFLKIASGTASPGSGNSINTSGVSLSSGTHIRSATLSDFTTTAVSAFDIIAVNLTTVGGAPTGLTATIECQ